jgi:hypothetical protein
MMRRITTTTASVLAIALLDGGICNLPAYTGDWI